MYVSQMQQWRDVWADTLWRIDNRFELNVTINSDNNNSKLNATKVNNNFRLNVTKVRSDNDNSKLNIIKVNNHLKVSSDNNKYEQFLTDF